MADEGRQLRARRRPTDKIIDFTSELVAEIRRMIGVVGFWDNATKQDELRKTIKRKSRSRASSSTTTT